MDSTEAICYTRFAMKKVPHEEEINFEPDEELGDLGAAKAKLRKLKDEFERIRKERQEYLDGWQRCKADSVNARRDAALEAQRIANRNRDALIEDIIPALDSFDMATSSEQWASLDDGWRSGMENVQNQLIDALVRHGAKRFGKVGDMFNPTLHEAVQEEHEGAHADGEIVRVLRSGYLLGERTLRPAQVIVFHAPHNPDA